LQTLKILFILFIGLVPSLVNAAQPTCHSSSGGYCSYTGKVQRIYINSGNLILLYFDTPLPSSAPASIGLNITRSGVGAAALRVESNPDFAKLFYSTALAAQASNRDITIQMRGITSGYLTIDRIWLAAAE